jgi:hypothetical protein
VNRIDQETEKEARAQRGCRAIQEEEESGELNINLSPCFDHVNSRQGGVYYNLEQHVYKIVPLYVTHWCYFLTYGAETCLRSRQLCSHSRTSTFSILWNPKVQYCVHRSSILILSTHVRLGLPSGVFSSDFLTNILHAFLFSPIRSKCTVDLILLDFIILIIPGEE